MAKRIEKWDILKLFLIFTVVLGHIADYYTGQSEIMRHLFFFIYIFHMPLFIFVSGLFSKRTVDEFRFDKILGYMIIYFFTKIVLALCYMTGSGKFSITFFDDGGLPWFMIAMFSFPLITYCVKKIRLPVVLVVSIAVALAVGYFRAVGTVFSLSRIIVYFPFYYLGYKIDAKALHRFVVDKKVKIACGVFIALLVIAICGFGEKFYFLRLLFTGRNSYYAIEPYFNYGFLLRLLCYGISMLTCLSVIALTPDHTSLKAVSVFGSRTLSVYVYHNVLLYILFNHFDLREKLEALLPWGTLLIIVPLSVAITILLSFKIFYKPLEIMMALPTKIRQKIKPQS